MNRKANSVSGIIVWFFKLALSIIPLIVIIALTIALYDVIFLTPDPSELALDQLVGQIDFYRNQMVVSGKTVLEGNIFFSAPYNKEKITIENERGKRFNYQRLCLYKNDVEIACRSTDAQVPIVSLDVTQDVTQKFVLIEKKEGAYLATISN